MLLLIMIVILAAGLTLNEPLFLIIPGIYIAFKLVLFILKEVSDRAKIKAGYKKKTRVVHHKIDDGLFDHEYTDTIEEWVREDEQEDLDKYN